MIKNLKKKKIDKKIPSKSLSNQSCNPSSNWSSKMGKWSGESVFQKKKNIKKNIRILKFSPKNLPNMAVLIAFCLCPSTSHSEPLSSSSESNPIKAPAKKNT